MGMNRRDFLKVASAAGLSVGSASFLGRAWAENDDMTIEGQQVEMADYDGPFVVFMQALGGWDPVKFCDPHGLDNTYNEGDILTAGNIPFAPVMGNDVFFNAHYQNMTVINGIDVATNSHDAGRRHAGSGRLGEGSPHISALVAGTHAPHYPMAFITYGGYDETFGVVAPTRDGNQGRLPELAWPHRITAADELSPTYNTPGAYDIISAAREERLHTAMSKMELRRIKNQQNLLMTARTGSNKLRDLEAYLPEPDMTGNPLFPQAQLAMAAYRAGVAVSANLSTDGFDTHSNHDASHTPRVQEFLAGIDFVWQEAVRQGVADKLVIIASSDFARTPTYNGGAGKDHWTVTSQMVIASPGLGFGGNKVVGATDDGQNARLIDPNTMLPTEDEVVGRVVTPADVHAGLRNKLGIDPESNLGKLFPLTHPDDGPLQIFDA